VSQIGIDAHVHDRLNEHLDGDLSMAEQAAVEAHLAHCDDCADELRALRGIVALLRDLPDPEVPVDFAARIAQRIESGEGRRVSRIATFTRRSRAAGVITALAAGFAGFLLLNSTDIDSKNFLGTSIETTPEPSGLQSRFGGSTVARGEGARRPLPPPRATVGHVASNTGFGLIGNATPEAPLRDLDGEFEALIADPAAFIERFRRMPEDARRPLIAPLVRYSAERGPVEAVAFYSSVGARPLAVRTSAPGR